MDVSASRFEVNFKVAAQKGIVQDNCRANGMTLQKNA